MSRLSRQREVKKAASDTIQGWSADVQSVFNPLKGVPVLPGGLRNRAPAFLNSPWMPSGAPYFLGNCSWRDFTTAIRRLAWRLRFVSWMAR
jgi:hypothetical protein